MTMRSHVAIVHCHYEPGGVTQVVQNHVNCLPPHLEIALLSGPRVSGLSETTLGRVELIQWQELDYDSQPSRNKAGGANVSASDRGRSLFNRIEESLRSLGWSDEDTVIHWHNHSLGKNAAAPYAIKLLADAGWKLLLQIHDFAEDQRPANYQYLIEQTGAKSSEQLDQILYPTGPVVTGPNIRYAVLTAGDSASLVEFGLDKSHVDTIPNSVRVPEYTALEAPASSSASAGGSLGTSGRELAMQEVSEAFGVDPSSRWILYPVRGIRRKNVGEFLLVCQLLHRANELAVASDEDANYVGAVTLRPDTPAEAASYDRWRDVAKQFVPNVVFDTGHHPEVSFVDNLAACHCVLTTSVAEGFGMAFLEPWLAGRRVVARNLPGVTADFVKQGVRLDDLYAAVWIPGDESWVDAQEQAWTQQRLDAWSSIPTVMQPIDRSSKTVPQQRFDFARLTQQTQVDVIARIAADDGFAARVIELNATIIAAIESPGDEAVIVRNRDVISSVYSELTQRDQLMNAYFLKSSRQIPGGCGNNGGFVAESDRGVIGRLSRMIDIIDRSHPFYPCRTEIL